MLTLLEKITIGLLVVALIGIIVVGALYHFIQTKEGIPGDRGQQGIPGSSLPPITAPLIQLNNLNFPNSKTIVSQYSKTITINASGSINDIGDGATIVLGALPNSITRPTFFPVSGIAYFDDTNIIPAVIDLNGNILVGPCITANVYTLYIVYSVA